MRCVFEALNRAVYWDGYTFESGTALGFVFANNWVGDNENDGYAFIDFNQALIQGGAIYGNTFGKSNCIRLDAAMNGLAIYGNLIGTIDFSLVEGGSYPSGVVVFGNTLQGDNSEPWPHFKNLNNNCRGCVTFGNAIAANNSDTLSLTGHIVTTPMYTVPPMITAATHITPTLEGDGFQGSNDITGRITLVVSGGPAASGIQCTVTYSAKYDSSGKRPRVFITPENAASVALMTDVFTNFADGDYTKFTINSIAGLSDGTYQWSYFVVG